MQILQSAHVVCDINSGDNIILSMTDFGKSRSGAKESDNQDKDLYDPMVAIAMAGAIAGSAILFAYASASESVTGASEVPLEPVIIGKIVEKPMYIERIKC